MTLLPGTLFLIDTSALARAHHKQVREIITGVIDAGFAATCATIDLEMGYAARNPKQLRDVQVARQELYQLLPLDERAAKRARAVQRFLADRGLHRAAGPMDLLTAAVAELNRAIVLHYDADFEHIASVTGQQQQWIMPRGSID